MQQTRKQDEKANRVRMQIAKIVASNKESKQAGNPSQCLLKKTSKDALNKRQIKQPSKKVGKQGSTERMQADKEARRESQQSKNANCKNSCK